MSAPRPATTSIDAPSDAAPRPPRRLLFVAGIVSRTWLWFVAGCMVVTLVPVLFGWRPFVIQSGSMEPRINVGDVILASPADNAADLLGRVTVFDVASEPGVVRSHRVIGVNADGTLTTQGDANPTPDSERVAMSDVRGLGRLLVGFAGLPFIWMQTGHWLYLILFILSLLGAGIIVSRDREDDDVEPADPDDDRAAGSGDGRGAAVLPMPTRLSTGTGAIAASRPRDPGLGRHMLPQPTPGRSWAYRARTAMLSRRTALRVGYVGALVGILSAPAAQASFAATTRSTANTWALGNWDYSSSITALAPWLYWKLDETGTGTTAADSSGNGRTGQYNTNGTTTYFSKGVVGALPTDTPNLAVTLTNANSCINTASTTTMNAPTQLTEVVWFKTTTTNGGKILGFEMPRTGVAVAGNGGTYDRHIYMDGAGKVWFGVYNGGYFTIGSSASYNDGAWHMAAASMGATGMKLYLDGAVVGTNANTTGETTTGWFRAGCGNLAGWGASWTGANTPGTNAGVTANRVFLGSLDEVSVWQTVLTQAQISTLYNAR